METIRLFLNRCRILFLKTFTNRVKEITVKDPATGKEYTATAVKTEEKVCAHARIEQVAYSFWKCIDCHDAWFEISYKVYIEREQLIGALDTVAKKLRTEFKPDETGEAEK